MRNFSINSFTPIHSIVIYKGIPITLNRNIKYLATDLDGGLHGFNAKPVIQEDKWEYEEEDEELYYIKHTVGFVYYKGDWANSLIKVGI
jgi:hypothetical protein